MPERQLNAITEVRRVMNRLGLHSDTVFWWVVVGNKTPTLFDREFRIREGTGADWLRASLDQLDGLYHPG
jgi:P2-related tail formation protein